MSMSESTSPSTRPRVRSASRVPQVEDGGVFLTEIERSIKYIGSPTDHKATSTHEAVDRFRHQLHRNGSEQETEDTGQEKNSTLTK